MAGIDYNTHCFTFTWLIENASYCLQKKGELIQSPAFVVDEISKTKWKLRLYPRGDKNGNYIGLYLHREFDSKGEKNVEIKYELAFVTPLFDLVLASHGLTQHSFPKGEGYGYPEFEKREDVFIVERSKYLYDNSLRVSCRIWKNLGDMAENVRCFARTRISVEKRSMVWNLKNFSSFEPGKECTYVIRSMQNDIELVSVNLSLTGGQNCEEMIQFQLTRHDQTIKYCALRLSLAYYSGLRRLECHQNEFWFDKLGDNIQRFTVLVSRQKLKAKELLNRPGDTLSLQWEWVFSRGIVSEEIEEVECGIILSKSSLLFQSKDHEISLFD